MTNHLFKLTSKIIRIAMKMASYRPDSYPYISGDGFRKISDHIYDKEKTFNPASVKANEIIFLNTDYIERYFKYIHPLIKHPYKLITHNSDRNIGEQETKYLDEKIIKWFAQNAMISNPKIIPIPIGLENLHHYFNGIPGLFNKMKRQPTNKIPRILYGFSISTSKYERQSALDSLKTNLLADKISGHPLPPQYLNILNSYQFIASPPGNGIDCHRTWEAMYLQTVPIVKRSPATEYWRNLNLPLLLIDDWSTLASMHEQELFVLYHETMTRARTEALFMDYWINKIKYNNRQ
jgi:hypothetical protein